MFNFVKIHQFCQIRQIHQNSSPPLNPNAFFKFQSESGQWNWFLLNYYRLFRLCRYEASILSIERGAPKNPKNFPKVPPSIPTHPPTVHFPMQQSCQNFVSYHPKCSCKLQLFQLFKFALMNLANVKNVHDKICEIERIFKFDNDIFTKSGFYLKRSCLVFASNFNGRYLQRNLKLCSVSCDRFERKQGILLSFGGDVSALGCLFQSMKQNTISNFFTNHREIRV